ncbi:MULTISPECIES: hypothetical protein [Lactobacillus]|jgi:hypothetical protein|uniref:hypothetical protein n=1 Tax=Lactobacillus TaxID=1578 RepID=UPI00065E2011|nr:MULTISPECIES: hypothetical protein [Lactobacillus]KAA9235353.1 hypothetical protein F6I36_06375 [Lactobacillus jensenii]KAA9263859.1 hypothetical protein F6I21_07270 [Lactobacillus jensenii]MCF1797269.1 hypothetical protein [Lactobacillus mulieris]MCF1846890.1 hypothetical protein [Lactobacillus mulieris]MCF1851612.1 hypothetical protein [Lactobacillus jensenii]
MLNILKESLNIIIHNTLTLFKPKREKKFVHDLSKDSRSIASDFKKTGKDMQNAMVNFKELEYLENTGTLKTVFKEGKKSKDSDFEDL